MSIEYHLHDLSSRTNVMVRELRNNSLQSKPIIIYDDHRWLLNVLFMIHQQRPDIMPNIVYFDAHEDAADAPSRSVLLNSIGVDKLDSATDKQFGAFVDYDCRTDVSDWLIVAMELGLIQDATNIGNRYNNKFEELQGRYQSEDGIVHKLFQLKDLSFELGCRGQLGDYARADEYKDIRSFFGINGTYDFTVGQMCPFVLDIDLDYFTMSFVDESTHGWTERVFQNHFPSRGIEHYFVKQLIDKAQVITICREPDYCGSLGNSNEILRNVDKIFFGGAIGTETTL